MFQSHWPARETLLKLLLLGTAASLLNYQALADEPVGDNATQQSMEYASGGRQPEPVVPPPDNPLAGTAWRLVAFQSMNDTIGTVRPHDPSRYTMHLSPNGMVTMRLNCNRATGKWFVKTGASAESGHFSFGPLATTRALCEPPSLDQSLAAQSQYIRSYVLQDGNLYLSLMADGGIYSWEPLTTGPLLSFVPAAAADGGPRNWEVTGVSSVLNLREQPSTTAGVAARLVAGTILDNLGCQRAAERVWCDVQPLGGGPRGFVAAAYLKPAISPDGSTATGPDDSALRAGQGKFDATGTVPCARSRGQPMMHCAFGVARAGGGYATVVITRPDGRTRAIFFRMGRPISADSSQADGYGEFSASRDNGLHLIHVGSECYQIPEAVVLGR